MFSWCLDWVIQMHLLKTCFQSQLWDATYGVSASGTSCYLVPLPSLPFFCFLEALLIRQACWQWWFTLPNESSLKRFLSQRQSYRHEVWRPACSKVVVFICWMFLFSKPLALVNTWAPMSFTIVPGPLQLSMIWRSPLTLPWVVV